MSRKVKSSIPVANRTKARSALLMSCAQIKPVVCRFLGLTCPIQQRENREPDWRFDSDLIRAAPNGSQNALPSCMAGPEMTKLPTDEKSQLPLVFESPENTGVDDNDRFRKVFEPDQKPRPFHNKYTGNLSDMKDTAAIHNDRVQRRELCSRHFQSIDRERASMHVINEWLHEKRIQLFGKFHFLGSTQPRH